MAKENSAFEFLVPTGFEWDEDKSDATFSSMASTSRTPAKFFMSQ
jgi:hypothetical protein